MLGLRFCARAFCSCGEWGPLLIAVRGPLTIAASPAAEHRLQTRRLSSCGSRAQLLRGTWDPPRPGLEPVSPALAGRFSTTAPPGKPKNYFIFDVKFNRNNMQDRTFMLQFDKGCYGSCVVNCNPSWLSISITSLLLLLLFLTSLLEYNCFTMLC